MKKLLALLPIAALVLTGCGPSTGKPASGPPALIQPADHSNPAPTTKTRELAEIVDNRFFEVTGTNSNGMPFRCYITEGYQTVAQTCFEYARP